MEPITALYKDQEVYVSATAEHPDKIVVRFGNDEIERRVLVLTRAETRGLMFRLASAHVAALNLEHELVRMELG
jgi:hypothetical protein